MSQKILNKRSSVFNKTPLPSQMEYGEIAINFNHENPFLSILDSKGEIQKFLSETKTRNLIAGVKNDIDASFYTKAQINQMFEDLESGGTISFDDYYTKAETDAKYQSLSGMSSYLTVASAEGLYQPIGDYALVSQLPDTSGYAQKSDLDDYLTISSANTIFATKEELEEHIPTVDAYTKAESDSKFQSQSGMTDYVLKSELPSTTGLASEAWVSQNFSTTAHTHDYSEIQNTPDLSGFASLSDIPDTSNFITSAFTEEHYMKIGSTPTDVYTKAESDSKFQAISAMTEYSQTGHTHDYETLTNKPDLSIYLTEHQDISGLATKQELENYMPNSGMTDYALKSEIPSIEGLATEAELANYQPVSAMTGYSTTAHTHSNYAEKSELANYQPVSGMNDYALASQIPSTAGLASETWVSQNFQPQSGMTNYALSGHTHSEYLTQTSADSRYARVVSCTQAQYDVLVQNDQVEQGVLYCIIETSN